MGSSGQIITTTDILNGTILPADLSGGGTANRLLTTDGTTPAWAVANSAMVGASAAVSRVLTSDGSASTWAAITTALIGANQVTQSAIVNVTAGAGINTTAMGDLSGAVINTLVAAGGWTLVGFCGTVHHNAANQSIVIQLVRDGAAFTYPVSSQSDVAGAKRAFSLLGLSPSTASTTHTWKVQFAVAPTGGADYGIVENGQFFAIELKR